MMDGRNGKKEKERQGKDVKPSIRQRKVRQGQGPAPPTVSSSL